MLRFAILSFTCFLSLAVFAKPTVHLYQPDLSPNDLNNLQEVVEPAWMTVTAQPIDHTAAAQPKVYQPTVHQGFSYQQPIQPTLQQQPVNYPSSYGYTVQNHHQNEQPYVYHWAHVVAPVGQPALSQYPLQGQPSYGTTHLEYIPSQGYHQNGY